MRYSLLHLFFSLFKKIFIYSLTVHSCIQYNSILCTSNSHYTSPKHHLPTSISSLNITYWVRLVLPDRILNDLVDFILCKCWARDNNWSGFMGTMAIACLGENISQRSLHLWLFHSFCPFFCNVPWALVLRVFCRCMHWDWAPWLCILTSCDL